VRSLGPVQGGSALSWLYAACDLFVCPSRSDNLPNTVLESLACGVPVIGSTTGGIPDMARPGQTGWLFQSGGVDDCAEAILAAIAERANWPAYKARCREVAEREYSPRCQADAYTALFAELIGKSG